MICLNKSKTSKAIYIVPFNESFPRDSIIRGFVRPIKTYLFRIWNLDLKVFLCEPHTFCRARLSFVIAAFIRLTRLWRLPPTRSHGIVYWESVSSHHDRIRHWHCILRGAVHCGRQIVASCKTKGDQHSCTELTSDSY